jgi:hypothetical protein
LRIGSLEILNKQSSPASLAASINLALRPKDVPSLRKPGVLLMAFSRKLDIYDFPKR